MDGNKKGAAVESVLLKKRKGKLLELRTIRKPREVAVIVREVEKGYSGGIVPVKSVVRSAILNSLRVVLSNSYCCLDDGPYWNNPVLVGFEPPCEW